MRELNEMELEQVAGGDQIAVATATSNQEAASINAGVLAHRAGVGNVSQDASNTAIAANINRSFNFSGNHIF